MTTLTCPKCRQQLPEDALDAGQCPLCGFPLDGPVVLAAAPTASGCGKWRPVTEVVATLLFAAAVAYWFLGRSEPTRSPHAPEVAALGPSEVERQVAPFPHEPPPQTIPTTQTPAEPRPDKPRDPDPTPVQPVVEVPKKDGPRPIRVVMKVDPKITPLRHFDSPDDTAALPDLNSGDRVALTGRVRVLRLGSVNGTGRLDASGLVADEVIITGDLNGEAQVQVAAPNGQVTVGGYVTGASKLTIVAPGGVVRMAATGRVTDTATVTATAKRFEANGPLSGNAKVRVTLSARGSLKLVRAEESATVSYKRAADTDPPPTIDKGELRGAAKVDGS
ncbi:hypothetical protein [Frigoriglobus tundricola]|uniref:Uncharacterized protein n=1 Tax=Frigoriglobus tundricola TaxID=2774151 RepID=A0A6M5Z4T2_9BACT|nr:hypothetical protein [Frigoriglobus tundricola]QJX00512.1 hypothetical protein FTUN_8142 [Frigoriglobus tundricola]